MKEPHLPTVSDCTEWAIKSGLTIRFFTTKTAWQILYCCTIESKIGNKIKTYEIKEHALNSCLYHIRKNYKEIFLELSCPPFSLNAHK